MTWMDSKFLCAGPRSVFLMRALLILVWGRKECLGDYLDLPCPLPVKSAILTSLSFHPLDISRSFSCRPAPSHSGMFSKGIFREKGQRSCPQIRRTGLHCV